RQHAVHIGHRESSRSMWAADRTLLGGRRTAERVVEERSRTPNRSSGEGGGGRGGGAREAPVLTRCRVPLARAPGQGVPSRTGGDNRFRSRTPRASRPR